MIQFTETFSNQLISIVSIVAIVTSLGSAFVAWGRRGVLQETMKEQQTQFKDSITQAIQSQGDEFKRAIQKLELDRVTPIDLKLLVERMESGLEKITVQLAGFAGRAGIIGDIEFLKKNQAENNLLQDKARHDLRSQALAITGALELRIQRLEGRILDILDNNVDGTSLYRRIKAEGANA